MMNNEPQKLETIWQRLPHDRKQQVMVLIGRMIQQRLTQPGPQQRQTTRNALDKTAGVSDTGEAGQSAPLLASKEC